jgi:tRNA pseudouridine13 synthase
MHQIKQSPEDFIVKEIYDLKEDHGPYSYFLLKKTNYTTIKALETIANKLNIPLKNIGFAGNKDKNAITEQKISIFKGAKSTENIEFKDIELKYLSSGKEPISLGNHQGNEFIITIRSLDKKEIEKLKSFKAKNIPNLFGPQRFSKNNDLVGKSLIKKDFRKAVELVAENESGNKIKDYIEKNKNDYVGALKLIPLKTRKLYVHAYQSYLFNNVIKAYKIKQHIKIPIIGFGLEMDEIKDTNLKSIIKKTLNEEKINPRDFIINQMPELTSEGGMRDLYFDAKNFKIAEIKGDTAKISFSLPKSCYATVLIESIFL